MANPYHDEKGKFTSGSGGGGGGGKGPAGDKPSRKSDARGKNPATSRSVPVGFREDLETGNVVPAGTRFTAVPKSFSEKQAAKAQDYKSAGVEQIFSSSSGKYYVNSSGKEVKPSATQLKIFKSHHPGRNTGGRRRR